MKKAGGEFPKYQCCTAEEEQCDSVRTVSQGATWLQSIAFPYFGKYILEHKDITPYSKDGGEDEDFLTHYFPLILPYHCTKIQLNARLVHFF